MKKQLEETIDKFFIELIEKHNFQLMNEKEYGLGALKDYESDNLFIRIVNDKGIVSLDIAPKGQQDKAHDIALYKELLNPPPQGCWNLSLQEQADYLENNWEWFNANLSGSSMDITLNKIGDCARKRTDTLVGSFDKKLDNANRNQRNK